MYERKTYNEKDVLHANDMNKIEEALSSVSNPNLLINGDFKVNQRGQVTYAPTKNEITYTVDRWCIFPSGNGTGYKLHVYADYVVFENTNSSLSAFMCQFLETPLRGTFTVSVKVKALTKAVALTVRDKGTFITLMTLHEGINTATITAESLDCIRFNISQLAIELEWVKIEAGSLGTPFVPRLYTEELKLCQRYYMPLPYNNIAYTGGDGSLYLCFDSNVLNLRVTPVFIGATEITFIYNGNIYTYPIETIDVSNLKARGYIKVKYTYSNPTQHAYKSMVAYFNKLSYLDSEIKG